MSVTPYFDDGTVTIYHGDCREVLPALGMRGAVITDPPYLTAESDLSRFGTMANHKAGSSIRAIPYAAATPDTLRELCVLVDSICSGFFVCFNDFEGVAEIRNGIAASKNIINTSAIGVWFRGLGLVLPAGKNTTACKDCEFLAIGKHKAYRDPRDRRSFFQTPSARPVDLLVVGGKPLSLMIEVVEAYTRPAEIVIDPFMGSGTTLRACKETGRKAIGVDVDEGRCEIAARRMSQQTLSLGGVA